MDDDLDSGREPVGEAMLRVGETIIDSLERENAALKEKLGLAYSDIREMEDRLLGQIAGLKNALDAKVQVYVDRRTLAEANAAVYRSALIDVQHGSIDSPRIAEALSSDAGAKLLAVVEAARKFDQWFDARNNNGGVNCDHVSEECMDAEVELEQALKALDEGK